MFTVYNTESGRSFDHYPTERKAKNALKKLQTHESTQRKPQAYACVTREWYDSNINIMVERINMMSQQPYMERLYTPSYCSPASESYWSM